MPPAKPLLLFTSFPGDGHTAPIAIIAAGMIHRGYEVAYLAGQQYESMIAALGAEFFPAPNPFTPEAVEALVRSKASPPGAKRFATELGKIFYCTLQPRVEALGSTLEVLRARDPARQIIVIEDVVNVSSVPYKFGRPLPKGFHEFPRTIGISPSPLFLQSRDNGPISLGLPPDSTPSGRLRNEALHKIANEGPLRPMFEDRDEAFRACGCTSIPADVNPVHGWYTEYDATMMLCSSGLDYPLSDIPSKIHFIGCLPRKPTSPDLRYPAWWESDVVERHHSSPEQKIVFVAQGTVSIHPEELIIPTIQAFQGRPDILVIAVLGSRDAHLPEDVPIPPNARIVDYFPYDAVLEHADVLVSNAGYGSFTHAIVNGVPAVFAGQSQEKSEVAARGEWAGFAKDLRTQTPAPEMIREAVDEILSNTAYRTRAVELKIENEAMDSLELFETELLRWTE